MTRTLVNIQSLAHGGDGVGRLPDGRTVFVPYTAPGDEIAVEITEDHGRWARGALLDLISPSSDRVEPPCPYFGDCGGCQWQHVSYPAQLSAKRQTLIETLARIGHVTGATVAEAVPSPDVYGYRNKVELTAKPGDRGLALGFMRARSTDVIGVDACALLPGRSSKLPKALAGAVRFISSRGAGGILRASVRVSSAGEIACDLWTTGGPFPRAAAAKVLAESTGARTVTRTIVRGDAADRNVSQVEVLSGSGLWTEKLGSDTYTISAPSFFQVNTRAAALLRDMAVELVDADGTMRVADLYSGAGTFTLPLAREAGEVAAIEASKYALGDLRRNLENAGLDADVVPGDAAYALPDLGHFDAAVIDPPRSGVSERGLEALVASRIPRVVYVSCDPATLARDVAQLANAGYRARTFVPVDLFPQTYHLETVALLELE